MLLNEYTLNDPPSLNGNTNVLTQAATNFLTIEQAVVYRQSQAATNFFDIEQEVRGRQAADNFLTMEQRVIDPTTVVSNPCNFIKPIIYIDGARVADSTLTGKWELVRSENNASLANFTVKQPCGSYDPDALQGKSVTIDVDDDGTLKRVYTGIIDIPEVDVIRGWITYRCTDRRRELINNQLSVIKNDIGYFSEAIFGEPKDTFEEVSYRLETVMQSVDFDQYGNYTLTDLNPKATPDYTLSGSSDVFRDSGRDPKVELTSRARVVNKVNVSFSYRYPKLYHWETAYAWQHPDLNVICDYLKLGKTFPSKEMVRQAAKSSGWILKAEPTFTPIWDSGFYRCGNDIVAFTTTVTNSDLTPQKDELGNNVTDANGDIVYTRTNRSFENSYDMWCLGTNFTLTNRWAQTIQEDYTLTVQAPQSQTKFGDVEQNAKYGVESEYETEKWEDYRAYSSTGPDGDAISGDTIINKDTNRTTSNSAIITALNRAKTTILKSHRDNRVTFVRSLWPEIDLKHTVRLNSTKIDVTGKVSEIRHTFDINNKDASTTVELSFSQSEGSTSDSALSVPSAPSYSTTNDIPSIQLGNHHGLDPVNTPGAETWDGMVGNKWKWETIGTITNITKTDFPVYFIVTSPGVKEDARENRVVTQSSSYNVEIPNDSFTANNECKC